MSFEDGWAALNLEMPARIPRTEYSAEQHWDLIEAVTGIAVNVDSREEAQVAAGVEFVRAWNYDLFWHTLIDHEEFGSFWTDMGHAEYAAGGIDRRDAVESPFDSPQDVLRFDPWDVFGPVDAAATAGRFEADYQSQSSLHPFGVNMTGVYVSLVSGLIDLFGWELLLLAAGEDPIRFGRLANRYASWIQQYFDALAEIDVPVVMVHDDMVWTSGPIFRPSWYREFVFPNYRRFLEPLLATGKKVLFTSDGDYTMFIDDVAKAGFTAFVFEPLTDLRTVVERYGQSHAIIGNVDTRVLLYGDRPAIRAEVERCVALGRDCPGYFIAVGNHIPPNTPVPAALYYNQVYEELAHR